MLSVSDYLNKIIEYHIQKKFNPFVGKNKMGLRYIYFISCSLRKDN